MAGEAHHLDEQQLRAFSEGRVAAGARDALQNHLDGCPTCCEALTTLVDSDPFVARLKNVKRPQQPLDHTLNAGAATRTDTAAVPSVPGYEIIRELGRGGMGVVYQARQLGLNRLVALKVLLAGQHAGPDIVARFRGEAEAVAQLRHENVVPIHDIGSHNSLPYFALEFCDGGNLAAQARGEPQPPRDAARLVESLARGVEAAHRLGIVHRDLKPANVLLSQGIPKISDFGLAKWLEHDSGLTGTNAIVGTPSYMSPEQAAGQGALVGVAADVYSLGVMLYELLTGRPPFQGPTLLDTLELVRSAEPVAPSRLQPGVPRDLETICLKCLRKEPSRRYSTARELSEDLAAFLDNRPIRARPAGPLERGRRWAQRNPTIAGLMGLVAAVTAIGFGLVTLQLVEKEAARADAETKREAADTERGKAITARNDSDIERGKAISARSDAIRSRNDALELAAAMRLDKGSDLAERGEVSAGLFWMLEAARTAPEGAAGLRHAARLNLAAWLGYAPGLRHRVVPPPLFFGMAFFPDGKRVLADCGPVRGLLWVNNKNEVVKAKWPSPGPCRFMVPSPDGRLLLTSQYPKNETILTQCWEVDTGRSLGEAITGPVCCPAFHPDGGAYAVAENGWIRLRDAISGKVVRELRLEDNASAICLAFSLDGKKLVVASGKTREFAPSTARIWDLDRGQPMGEPMTHSGSIQSMAFSPDGKTVATGGFDRTIRRWDAVSGKPIGAPLVHTGAVHFVGFTPDGGTIATGDEQGTLLCWDAETGQRLISTLPRISILPPLLTADGKHMVTLPDYGFPALDNRQHPGVIEFWQVGRGAYGRLRLGANLPTQKMPGQTPPIETTLISPDGSAVLLRNPEGRVRLLDAASMQPRGKPIPRTWTVVSAVFSPDGKRLALGRSDWTHSAAGIGAQFDVIDVATGEPIRPSLIYANKMLALAFSPDGKLLVTGDYAGLIQTWDLATGKVVGQSMPHGGQIHRLAISPDGRTLVVEHSLQRPIDHNLTFWDLSPRQQKWKPLPLGREAVWDPGPDCEMLLVRGWGHDAFRQWNAATGEPTGVSFRTGESQNAFARFSRDGRTLLTGSAKSTRQWDVATGQPLGKPMLHPSDVRALAISPDPEGRFLLIGCMDGSVRLWDRATCRPLGPPVWHESEISSCGFSADGRSFVTASQDGRVRTWPVPVVSEELGNSPEDFDRVRLRLEVRTGLTLGDGEAIEQLVPAEWRKRQERLIELEGSLESAYSG